MNAKCVLILTILAVSMAAPSHVKAAPSKKKTSSNLILKVDSHNNTRNADGNFDSEVFFNTMFMANRPLTKKKHIGSVFILNRRSVSDNDAVSNTIGVNTISIINKHVTGMMGYSYTSNAERTAFTPGATSDRLSFNVIYTLNPAEKKKPQYSMATSFGTLTNWGDQRSLSEKLGAKFPIKGEKITGSLGYRYSYNLNGGEQSSNQFTFSATWKLKEAKFGFGISHFNNVFPGNRGDDTVFDISWTYSGL